MVGNEGYAELVRWAASRGVTDVPRSGSDAAPNEALGYSLCIADFPHAGGRGLAASRDLKEGDLILRVPKSALMSVLTSKEDAQLARAVALHPELSSTQILSVHLLNEVAKGKLSFWHLYLLELPRLHHTLAHFSPTAIQALQVEDAIRTAQKAVGKARMDWEAAKPLMQAIRLGRRFRSLNAWLWASATVSSRTLHVQWDEAGTLCPIGDLFNYAPPGELYIDSKHLDQPPAEELESVEENVALEVDNDISCDGVTLRERLQDGGYEPEFDEYCFYARQDYQRGEQVLLCYGQYNNLELLEHYGFSMAQNPNEAVHFSLPDCAEFGSSGDYLPVKSSGTSCIEVNGCPSFSLLAGLRLRAVKASMRKAMGHYALMGEQISRESDILVFQWLRRKCHSMLTCLPTSLEDDLALMELGRSAQDLSSFKTLCNRLCEGKDGTRGAMSSEDSGDHDLQRKGVLSELKTIMMISDAPKDDADNSESFVTDFQLERWKLALGWRIGYKHILHRCCLFCARKVRQLNKQ